MAMPFHPHEWPCDVQARKSAKGKDKKEARKALNNTIIKEQQTVKDVLAKANEVGPGQHCSRSPAPSSV